MRIWFRDQILHFVDVHVLTYKALMFHSISLVHELLISLCQVNKKHSRRFWKAIQPTHQSTTIEEPPNWLIFSCAPVLQ